MGSVIKADKIGVEMTKKSKRIGCSGFKSVLEAGGLILYDKDTIDEINTFEVKGTSYEATDGNNDDLVMNLVLFGYLIGTKFFANVSDINLKEMLFQEKMKQIEDDVVPFGGIDNGLDFYEEEKNDPAYENWAIPYEIRDMY
jgi:hypothetical protein